MDDDPRGSSSRQTSTDLIFEALAHERRRRLLVLLRRHETPLGLADAADELAERECAAPLQEIPAEDVKRIYMSLYHTHVPKLAEADLVRYEQDRDLIAPAGDIERAARFLEVDPGREE